MARVYLVAAAICTLALLGCGSKDDGTITSPDGSVTVTKDGANVVATNDKGTTEIKGTDGAATITHTGPEGTTTATTGAKADMSGLGVATYPGASVEDGGSAQVAIDTPQGKQLTVAMKTTDSVDMVIEFYKKEIASVTTLTSPDGGSLSGTTKSGDTVVVVVSKEDAGTKIGINVTKKK